MGRKVDGCASNIATQLADFQPMCNMEPAGNGKGASFTQGGTKLLAMVKDFNLQVETTAENRGEIGV